MIKIACISVLAAVLALPGGVANAASGEAVYQSLCSACHATGVAGAPMLSATADWAARIKHGKDQLYQRTVDGFQGSVGMMPPKGGNPYLTDDEVKAAVDFMISKIK